MSKIQSFDNLTETAKYLITSIIGDLPVWPKNGETPDFLIRISDVDIDPTDFFQELADTVDEQIESESEDKALRKLDVILEDLSDEIQEYNDSIKKLARRILARKEEES